MPGRLCSSRKARPISAGAKVPKLSEADQVAEDADDQGGDRQQQQELDQALLRRRQGVQRQAAKDLARKDDGVVGGRFRGAPRARPGRRSRGRWTFWPRTSGHVAEAEDEVGRRHLAEVVIEGAHRQPVVVDPGLDPDVGRLLAALAQGQAGDQPGGDAAVAAQGDEQPALGRRSRRCRPSGTRPRCHRGPPRLGSLPIS